MPTSPEVYGHALITRGWMDPEQLTRNPVRWEYTIECSGSRARGLFMRIRSLAMKSWNARGVDLWEQVMKFMESASAEPDLRGRVQIIVQARKTFYCIMEAGYPHFQSFVDAVDEVLDETARLVRREIVARLLDGRIAGPDAVEQIALLQDDPDATARLLTGIEELERGVA
jgi:hypothetical protein